MAYRKNGVSVDMEELKLKILEVWPKSQSGKMKKNTKRTNEQICGKKKCKILQQEIENTPSLNSLFILIFTFIPLFYLRMC